MSVFSLSLKLFDISKPKTQKNSGMDDRNICTSYYEQAAFNDEGNEILEIFSINIHFRV